MGRRWHMLLGLGAGLLVAGYSLTSLVGCSNASTPVGPRPTASQLEDGLTILDAKDPNWGVNAAYVKGGRVMYIETRVGAPKPSILLEGEAANEPRNEMDMRFVDQENHTFFAVRGGDNFADPTWAAEIVASRHLPPAAYANRAVDMQVAHEAAARLQSALPIAFADHAFHLNAFATSPTPTEHPALANQVGANSAVAPSVTDVTRNQVAVNNAAAYGTYGYGQWSIFLTAKYSKSCCAGMASHSSTQMWDYEGYYSSPPSSGTWTVIGWVFGIEACNHGTCPYSGTPTAQSNPGVNMNDSNTGMTYDCYKESNWYYNTAFNGETNASTTGHNDGTGGCQTAYNWDSGVGNGSDSSGSHLCNDDAAYELYQSNNHPNFAPESFYIYSQVSHCDGCCCGSSPSNYSCGNYGSDSGDWNTPDCGGSAF